MLARLLLLVTVLALVPALAHAQAPFEDLIVPVNGVTSLDAASFYLVIGASANGQVRVYTRSAVGTPWTLDGVLAPSDGAPACFGNRVALSQGRVLVSDPCKATGGASGGRAHMFRRDPGGWVEEAVFVPPTTEDDFDFFGYRVALDGTVAAVGAPDDGSGSYGGTILYALTDGTWVPHLTDADASALAASAPYVTIGGGDGRGVTVVYEHTPTGWATNPLAGEPGSASRASTGQLGLDGTRLLRIASGGIRSWVKTGTDWVRVGELPLSSSSIYLDVRGGRAAVRLSTNGVIRLYRTDASGLGWAGPIAVGAYSACESPQVAPTFIACGSSGSNVIRIFDTTALPDPPATPVLTAPADGAQGERTVTFAWEPVPGATSYVLEYSEYPDLIDPGGDATPSRTGLTAPTVTITGLSENTTYYWHVRAVSAAGSGAWSPTRVYRTEGRLPPPPPLVSPADDTAFTASVTTALFRWEGSGRTDDYRLQIAPEPTFSAPVVDQLTLSTQVTVPLEPLTRGQLYHWRVIARNVAGTSVSDVRTFMRASDAPTAAPVLASPADGTADVPRQTTLSWQVLNGAASYDLWVSASPTFDPILHQQLSIVGTEVTLPEPLAALQTHYWQVRGRNVNGVGPWSAPWSFTTGGQIVSADDEPSGEPALRVAPNPSAGPATATLALPTAARASVRLVDALGRELAVLLDGDAPAGASALALPSLPAGTYWVLAETEVAGEAHRLRVGVVVAR